MKKIALALWVVLLSLPATVHAQGDTSLIYKYDMKQIIAKPVWRTTQKSFAEAKELGADYVLIHMNTYGGLLDMGDSIRTLILNSPIPSVVFVDNQAISAGALIAIACDHIYMRPGGSIGAATVVNQTGEQVPDKFQSFMRGMMRATAEAKGKDTLIVDGDTSLVWRRNPAIAEAMVDPKVFVPGVSDTGQVVTLTAQEALELGFNDAMADNVEEVIRKLDIDNYRIVEFKPGATEKLIQFLISPAVSGILIILIIGGLYFELQSPGIGFPLAVSIIGGLLYFAPLYLEGLAENWEILVFLAGIVLIAVEIFAIPGFGVAGITGITLVIAGLTLSMVDNIVFRFDGAEAARALIEAFAVVILSTLLSVLLSLWLSKMIFTPSRLLPNLALNKVQNPDEGYVSFDSKLQHSLKGREGIAHTVLRPSGKVLIDDDIYDAKSEYGYIEKGDPVRVVRDEAGQLYVVKAGTGD